MKNWIIDTPLHNPGWTREEAADKDGRRIPGRDIGDWHAWLRREGGDMPNLHMKLQFGSEHVDKAEADRIVIAVLDGLNTLEAR